MVRAAMSLFPLTVVIISSVILLHQLRGVEVLRRSGSKPIYTKSSMVKEPTYCKTLWFSGFHSGDNSFEHYAKFYSAALLSSKNSAKGLFQPVLIVGHLEESKRTDISPDVQRTKDRFYHWAEDQGAIVIHRQNHTFQEVLNRHFPSHSPQLRQGPFIRLDIPNIIDEYSLLHRENICQDNDVVLYTDCDVMFNNLTLSTLEGVKESSKSEAAVYGAQSAKRDEALNTGVMFFSAGKLMSQLEDIFEFGNKNNFSFPAFDHGLLNAYFTQNKTQHLRAVLPFEWNYKAYWGDPGHSARSPFLLHFHGPKPEKLLECLASMDPDSSTCQKSKESPLWPLYGPLIGFGFTADRGSLACKTLSKYNHYLTESLFQNEVSATSTFDCDQNDSSGLLQSSSASLYQASAVEEFVRLNSQRLGYERIDPRPAGCDLWQKDVLGNATNPWKQTLATYRQEQKLYNEKLSEMISSIQNKNIQDVRNHLDEEVCNALDLNLPDTFKSGSLSYTRRAGYIEPLLPPLRDPELCFVGMRRLMGLDYLIHDFSTMCHKLKKSSRIVFFDLGASLDFHGSTSSPALYITHLFEKVGFKFDHIYAYEVTPKDPSDVYSKVPSNLMAAYHWINVGVEGNINAKMNPLTLLLNNYKEDDFVVIKLDIDTSFIEVPLAEQIINDERVSNLVDVVYFEHHVHLKELETSWQKSMNGTLADSLRLFQSMRQKGIAAHSWV